MKKSIFIILILVSLMSACQKKQPSFTLTANNLPAEFNNQYAYISDYENVIDSALIINGSVTLTSDSLFTDRRAMFSVAEEIYAPFVVEAGNYKLISVVYENVEYTYAVVPEVDNPSSFNAKLNDFYQTRRKISEPFEKEYQALYHIVNEGAPIPEDSAQLLEDQMLDINLRHKLEMNSITQKLYDANKNNALGLTAFGFLTFESDSDYIKAYESASDLIKSDNVFTEMYKASKEIIESQSTAE